MEIIKTQIPKKTRVALVDSKLNPILDKQGKPVLAKPITLNYENY